MLAGLVWYGAVAAYSVSCAAFFARLTGRRLGARTEIAGPLALAAAALLHGICLFDESYTSRVCPVRSVHFVISFSALLGTVIYLVFCRSAAIRALGVFLAPVALTFVLGARFLAVDRAEQVSGSFLALHITVNVLGDALFLLASAAALLYLVEERRLKQRRPASVFGKLPPLDALDRAEHRFLLGGFPLLTLGIVTGTVWAHAILSGGTAEIARAVLAYATWLLFAGVLLLRGVLGWRGRRAAYGTLAGFAFAVGVLVVYLVRATPGSGS